MDKYEMEELILSMADLVIENRWLRQEVERLKQVEKEFHAYIQEELKVSDQGVRDALRVPLENICSIMSVDNACRGWHYVYNEDL